MEFKLTKYSTAILRLSMGLVFLYFGFQQIISPDSWAGYVPSFVSNIIVTTNNVVVMNGILEITLGIFLVLGLYTRFASLILSFHLFLITLSIGFEPTGIRDFGLSLATFVVFLNGADKFCLDKKIGLKEK